MVRWNAIRTAVKANIQYAKFVKELVDAHVVAIAKPLHEHLGITYKEVMDMPIVELSQINKELNEVIRKENKQIEEEMKKNDESSDGIPDILKGNDNNGK